MGIEPTQPAWKAGILPLNYTRMSVKHENYFNMTLSSSQEKFIFYEIKISKSTEIYFYVVKSGICRPLFDFNFKLSVFDRNIYCIDAILSFFNHKVGNFIFNFSSYYIFQISCALYVSVHRFDG